MAEQHRLDEVFCEIVSDIKKEIKRYPKQDQRNVIDWIEETNKKVRTDENRRARNDYGRYLLYIVQSRGRLSNDFDMVSIRDPIAPTTSTNKTVCYNKNDARFADKTPRTDITKIREIIEDVAAGKITRANEFIFSVAPYVEDHGVILRTVLEEELQDFRRLVRDTIDRQIQDESDVMIHMQNGIKKKFQLFTEAMFHRTARIKQRLYEISPTFDWVRHGKDKDRLSKLIKVKRKEMSGNSNTLESLLHQAFVRGRWLKMELRRLQDENATLEASLSKFESLASERKCREFEVPRMLREEKKFLEKELDDLRDSHRRNSEMIDELYIQSQRCVKFDPLNEDEYDDDDDEY